MAAYKQYYFYAFVNFEMLYFARNKPTKEFKKNPNIKIFKRN